MEHAPGTFCWTDLAAPDMEAAERFYSGLFGWAAQSAGGDTEETRGYTYFTLNGKRVCAYGPPGPGEPPSWRPYVAVESADDAAASVRDNGGQLLLEPMDVLDQGRIAVFTDPAGAVCCVWQPRAHEGADVMREVGAIGWLEHATSDVEGAKRFYGAAFGWGTRDIGDGGYATWTLEGQESDVGGLTTLDEHPPGVPPHWLVSFVVEDSDGAAARARELGGEVRVPPRTIDVPGAPSIRFGVLADLSGAVFGILATVQP